MIMQTKITTKAIRMTLFFCLYSASVWSVAGSVSTANQADPAGSATMDSPQSAALSHAEGFANSTPTPTVALLERVRINGRQQAAKATFSLGVMAIDRKDFAAAQLLIREAIQLQPSHPGYRQAAAGLAFNMGEFVEAEMYLMQSLELTQAELARDDIRIVMLMDDLGTIYLAQQQYEQAERTWRKSLSMREQILGDRHPSIAPRLKDLARLVMHDKRFDETEQLLKRMVDILQADAGSDRTDVATAQHILADFYVNQQRMNEADVLYRIVLTELKAAPAQQRLQIAAELYELGNEYLSQLRLEEARSQFELVLGLLEGDFENGHPYVSGAKTALNKLKVEREKHDEERALGQAGGGKLQGQLSQRRVIM